MYLRYLLFVIKLYMHVSFYVLLLQCIWSLLAAEFTVVVKVGCTSLIICDIFELVLNL